MQPVKMTDGLLQSEEDRVVSIAYNDNQPLVGKDRQEYLRYYTRLLGEQLRRMHHPVNDRKCSDKE